MAGSAAIDNTCLDAGSTSTPLSVVAGGDELGSVDILDLAAAAGD